MEDPVKLIHEIDLYHSFEQKGLLAKHNPLRYDRQDQLTTGIPVPAAPLRNSDMNAVDYQPQYYINFWEYYEEHNGWNADKQDQIIDLLQKLRFFNRFEPD